MSKKGVDFGVIIALLLLATSLFFLAQQIPPSITGLAIGLGGGSSCSLCPPAICYNSVSCSNKCPPGTVCLPSPDICCGLCPAHGYTCVDQSQIPGFQPPPFDVCTGDGPEQCDGLDNDCDGIIDELCDKDLDAYCDDGMWYRKDDGEQNLTLKAWAFTDIYKSKITYLDNRTGKKGLYVYDLNTKNDFFINSESNPFAQQHGSIWKDYVAWTNRTLLGNPQKFDVWLTNITNGQRWLLLQNVYDASLTDIYEDNMVLAMNDITRPGGYRIIQLVNVSDPQTPKFRNITNQPQANSPRIYKNLIVWEDQRNRINSFDVFAYNLNTGIETQLSSTETNRNPDVYDDGVVWNNYTDYTTDVGQVAFYNLTTGRRQQITKGYNRIAPYQSRIHNSFIVYNPIGSGSWDIVAYHLPTGTTINVTSKETSGMLNDRAPAIYERLIAWYRDPTASYPIYSTHYRDLSPGPICLQGDCDDRNDTVNPAGTEDPTCNGMDEDCDGLIDEGCEPCLTAPDADVDGYKKDSYREELVSNASEHQAISDVYKNIIVWQDNRKGIFNTSSIYYYDINTGKETQVTDDGIFAIQPSVYGDAIVYQKYVSGNNDDIWLYNITNKTHQQITNLPEPYEETQPAIYQNLITYFSDRNFQPGDSGVDVYLYDLNTRTEIRVTPNSTAYTTGTLDMYENYITWIDRREGKYDTYLYNIINQTQKRISTLTRYADRPSTDGRYVTWRNVSGNGKIYSYNTETQKETVLIQQNGEPGKIRQGHLTYLHYSPGPDYLRIRDLNTNQDKKIIERDYGLAPEAIYEDIVTYTKDNTLNGTRIDLYYINTSIGACGDCNDTNASINPGVNETCYNGIDDNCNGNIDEGCTPCNIAPDIDDDSYKADSWEEKPAANNPTYYEDYSNTYNDAIVYSSDQTGRSQIYMYNLTSSVTTQVTSYPSEHKYPRIYKDKIVYQDDRNHAWPSNPYYDIYLYNITSGTETRITTQTTAGYPNLYDRTIVWMDYRNAEAPPGPDYWDVYLYDLQTHTETRITTQPTVYLLAIPPIDIFGNYITWSDTRNNPDRHTPPYFNNRTDIYLYNLATSQETKISTPNSTWNPTTDGSYVAYVGKNYLPGGGFETLRIYLYNIPKKKESEFTLIPQGTDGLQLRQQNVVYGTPDKANQRQLHVKNVNSYLDKKLTLDNYRHMNPSIWQDIASYTHWNGTPLYGYDVYYLNLSQNYTCGDCADDNASIQPGVNETCYNYIDDNCNGIVDEGCIPLVCSNSTDLDADTYKADFNQEYQVTDDPQTQSNPSTYENLIAYEDSSTGKTEIWLYNIDTGEKKQLTNNPLNGIGPLRPSIYGDYVVYQQKIDPDSFVYDIYLYNLSNDQETALITDANNQIWPRIYKNRIAYLSNQLTGNASYDVYWYNINTGVKTKVTTAFSSGETSGDPHPVDIYEDAVVWQDNRNGNWDVYWKNTSTIIPPQRITNNPSDQTSPAIHDKYLIWKDQRNGNNDIYGRQFTTPPSGTDINLTTNNASQNQPELHQEYAVWTDNRHGKTQIYYYNLTPKQEKRLTRNNKEDNQPSIYEDTVAYIKKNGTGFVQPQYDLYYTHINDYTICGDCDDDNASININKTENSSINPGVCGNKIDDDCDKAIDCDDPSCFDSPECIVICAPTENQCGIPPCCSDGVDNDCDGPKDCDDLDCGNEPQCAGNATLYGYVFDDQQWPIDIATVTGYPPFKPVVATFTDIVGFYNFTVPSGVYTFKADKFGYDPDIDELTLANGTDNEHNFTLHNATCHADCTNSEGRCNKDCEGYTYQGDSCHFANQTVAKACNDKRKGTTQTLQTNQSWYLLVDCCEGLPYYEFRPKLTVQGPMEDLYKLTSIVSKGGDPVKLHVNVWRK